MQKFPDSASNKKKYLCTLVWTFIVTFKMNIVWKRFVKKIISLSSQISRKMRFEIPSPAIRTGGITKTETTTSNSANYTSILNVPCHATEFDFFNLLEKLFYSHHSRHTINKCALYWRNLRKRQKKIKNHGHLFSSIKPYKLSIFIILLSHTVSLHFFTK